MQKTILHGNSNPGCRIYPFLIADPIIIPATIIEEERTIIFESGTKPNNEELNLTMNKTTTKYTMPNAIKINDAIIVTRRFSARPPLRMSLT
jgi:hypothetical protein